ncbi:MAG: ATP-binding cassette domain-containing protein, partial [Clostridiales bacterium]|nr:ATP-binding cassette domain-containing protein [Clostridiales bacterium]
MLPSNKIIALVGENGAGKTTTLKLMMGLLKKTHGNIIVKGKT